MNCPCRSGKSYQQCCGRFITQRNEAEHARDLMRSRYCAYVLNESDYLMQTWHPDYRPSSLMLDTGVKWIGLEIIADSEQGDNAMVEFEACLAADGRIDALHEKSRFERIDGRWFYTDGDMMAPRRDLSKIGRNAPCPCGSGSKFKRCCGATK